MKREEFEALNPEIKEYIQLGHKIGFINSNNIQRIYERIKNIEIVIEENDLGSGGMTEMLDDNKTIKITISKGCIEREAKSFDRNFKDYYDENLFHELTHALGITPKEFGIIFKEFIARNNLDESLYPNYDMGYSLIDEIIAQTTAQRMVTEKYNIKYPSKHSKFIFNEHNNSDESFKYEYDSDLQWYGELQNFALDFIEKIYGKRDINLIFNDHFNGLIFKKMLERYEKEHDGAKKLYSVIGSFGNILCCDYYQQGYYGEGIYKSLSVDLFKNSINECKELLRKEISLDD